MEKRENLNCADYAEFADYCNEKGLRIEINGDAVLGLEKWEKVVNGDVVSCLNDVDYVLGIKRQKMAEIENFDASVEINSFTIDDVAMWLDKSTRLGLRINIQDAISMGHTSITVWGNDHRFCLSPLQAQQLLIDVELYAKSCYEVTAQHKALVSNFTKAVEITTYDYRKGYPTRLAFDS